VAPAPATRTHTSSPKDRIVLGAEKAGESLLILQGLCNGVKAWILIDSGASRDFVSQALVDEHGWGTVSNMGDTAVYLASGTVQDGSQLFHKLMHKLRLTPILTVGSLL
jgi:hypothetical protein